MGDVAMAVPVIKNALDQSPHLQITVVSNAFFEPLFSGVSRCHFHPAYLKEKHKGAAGMLRLFKELRKQYSFDAVADLHNVLRSTLLRLIYSITGTAIATVDKGRKEKKALTRKENKIVTPLTPMHERYAQVLRRLGVDVLLDSNQPIFAKQMLPAEALPFFSGAKKIIGAAPFAQHLPKMYPLSKMKMLLAQLTAEGHSILLFGAPGAEAAMLQQWADEIPSVINTAGRFSFAEELAIISNLHLMISMDSANMHLASLYNVPVVSIWGATHPYAGFYGWGQQQKNIVDIQLDCRPCSVFGNKPCWRGDHACMENISTEIILRKIAEV